MLGFLRDLSPGRETPFNVGNLTREILPQKLLTLKNGPRWLIFEFLLESRLLRGKEWSSLLVHAFTTLLVFLLSVFPFTLHFFFLISRLPLFFLFFFLSFFLLLFFLALSYLFLSVISCPCPPSCAQPRPFYTAYCDGFYYFIPQLLLSRCGCPSQTTHWFVNCPAITASLCWPCHIPFPDKRVFFCFLALHSIPIRIRVGHSLLLTPIACT